MNTYASSIDMYKTKASLSLQFGDSIIVLCFLGSIVPLVLGGILRGDLRSNIVSPLSSEIMLVVSVIILAPIVIWFFSYLKYKEYNYGWKECIIKEVFAVYKQS